MVDRDSLAEPPRRVQRVLGRYELLAHLANGGMAEVFLARNRDDDKIVCIKRVLPELAHDPAYRQMFLDEGELALRLQHPNLVSALELVDAPDQPYLAMEYVEGETLASLQRRLQHSGTKLSERVTAYIVSEVANGLHAAHTLVGDDNSPLHVVHGDVSPQNILLGYDGRVWVIDFGVANARTHTVSAFEHDATAVKGKFGYMAPEQLAGEALDARTDIFGLGVVLYEMLTGTRLYTGDDPIEMLKVVGLQPIPPPRTLADVSLALDGIAMKALEKSKNDRYATAADCAAALAALAGEHRAAREELATSMRTEFATRMAQKGAAATLQRARLGETMSLRPPSASTPAPHYAREPSIPSLAGPTDSEPPTSIVARKPVDIAQPQPHRNPARLAALVALIAAVAVVLWYGLR